MEEGTGAKKSSDDKSAWRVRDRVRWGWGSISLRVGSGFEICDGC